MSWTSSTSATRTTPRGRCGYVASLTEVKNYRITKDDVAVYTAGIVETEVVYEEVRGTHSRPEMFVRVRCRIDSAVLAREIAGYRENDDLKAQLDSALRENESLRKDRDALLSRMRNEKDRGKVDDARKQLDTVLAHEEANDEVMKYWKRLAHRLFDRSAEIGKGELDEATASLVRISREYPKNSRARFLLASIYQRNEDWVLLLRTPVVLTRRSARRGPPLRATPAAVHRPG